MSKIQNQENHKLKVDRLWAQSENNRYIIGFKEGKKFDELLDSKERRKFFEDTPGCLGCSDGRIHEARLGRAGMGIVAGVEATVAAIKKIFEDKKISGKLTIKSHDGCGAAKIVCQKLIENGELSPNYDSDDLGRKFAQEVQKKLQAEGYEVGCEHIGCEEMDEIHDERCVYFDGTKKLCIENSDLPRGFIFSDLEYTDTECVTELEALCGIALGEHGFGSRFNKENPFRIIISAENQEQLRNMEKIAEMATSSFNDKVVFEGFVIGE